MNKIMAFAAVSVFYLALSTVAAAAEKLTLQDAISSGLASNPEFGVAAKTSLATREILTQAKALYLPSIDLTAETGNERTNTTVIDNEKLWRSRTSLTLTQLLFDGGGTLGQINRQKARIESSVSRTLEAAESVGLDIIEAYLDVLHQKKLLANANKNLEAHGKILDMISAGADTGTMTQGDAAQANARFEQAQATLSSTDEDLKRAISLFVQKAGVMPDNLAFPDIPRDKLPATVDEAVAIVFAQNPSLAASRSDLKAAQADYEGAGAGLYPRLNLEANASTGNNVSGFSGNENRQSVLAVMRWNLYRGGADKARQREALYRQAATQDRRDQTARQVEKEVRDTWTAMLAAADHAQAYKNKSIANEKVVSVYVDQFTLNRRTLLDVLDAQNELFVAKSNHITSLYTTAFAVFRILALEGKLLDSLNIPQPAEAQHAAR